MKPEKPGLILSWGYDVDSSVYVFQKIVKAGDKDLDGQLDFEEFGALPEGPWEETEAGLQEPLTKRTMVSMLVFWWTIMSVVLN